MMQSNQGIYLSQIDIPLQWCGTDSLKQEHCVQNEEEMSKLDSGIVIAPRDWHQKLDALEISSDVVFDNIDMLRLLESKSGRKKLESKKTTDELKKLLPKLAGDDSVHVAKQIALMQKEEQEAKRRKLGGDFIPDSTLEVITAGLTGTDSIAAIKKYLATRKAEKSIKGDKKYQKAVMALDTATIASITKGLSGADSINALKNYVEPKAVKVNKKQKTGDGELDSATIAYVTKGLTGADSVNAIRSYVMAQQSSKENKKKEYNGNVVLDSATIASVTNGLSGQDSVVALRNYVNAQRDSRKHKKRVKEVAPPDGSTPPPFINPTNTDSSKSIQPIQPTQPVLPVTTTVKPAKAEKRKKKASDELDDSTIATITKGLTGADSINAIREYKIEASKFKNDYKHKKVNKPEQVIIADTTTSTQATQPANASTSPIVNKQDSAVTQPQVPVRSVVQDTSTTVPKAPTVTTPIITTETQATTPVNASTSPIVSKQDSVVTQPQVPLRSVIKDTATIAPPVSPVITTPATTQTQATPSVNAGTSPLVNKQDSVVTQPQVPLRSVIKDTATTAPPVSPVITTPATTPTQATPSVNAGTSPLVNKQDSVVTQPQVPAPNVVKDITTNTPPLPPVTTPATTPTKATPPVNASASQLVNKQDSAVTQPQVTAPSVSVVKDTVTTAPTITPVTTTPTIQPPTADTTTSKKDSSLTQPALPSVAKDSTNVVQQVVPPTPAPVDTNSSRKRVQAVVPPPAVDSAKTNTNTTQPATTTDSTSNANKPLLPVADSTSNKVPADSTKPK
jgi:hypothetical protein